MYGVSFLQYIDAITNLLALYVSASTKTATKIIDEICLHSKQCKKSAAMKAKTRLTSMKFHSFICPLSSRTSRNDIFLGVADILNIFVRISVQKEKDTHMVNHELVF